MKIVLRQSFKIVPTYCIFVEIVKSARKICYEINDFISGSRTNTFGRLRYIDWIKFAAIDPLVFYNDYYGKIDANGDGKLQKSEIEECYRRVLEKYPNCPGILSSFSDFLFQNSNSTKTGKVD